MTDDDRVFMGNNRMPKDGGGTYKTSNQALSYAKAVLSHLYKEETWTLAERLDILMSAEAVKFMDEIRNGQGPRQALEDQSSGRRRPNPDSDPGDGAEVD